jgi:hypothetical protein
LDEGIQTGIHYPIALPNLLAYRYLKHDPKDFPIATQFSKEILSLPIYPELESSQVEYSASSEGQQDHKKISNVSIAQIGVGYCAKFSMELFGNKRCRVKK